MSNRKFTVSSFKEKILIQSAKKLRSNTAEVSKRWEKAFWAPAQFLFCCPLQSAPSTLTWWRYLKWVTIYETPLSHIDGHCFPKIKILLFLLAVKKKKYTYIGSIKKRLNFTSIHRHCYCLDYAFSLVVQLVKNLPAIQETWVWSLGWEDPLEKGRATHSSILAWRIAWTSPWGRRVGHDWMTFTFTFMPFQKLFPNNHVWYW